MALDMKANTKSTKCPIQRPVVKGVRSRSLKVTSRSIESKKLFEKAKVSGEHTNDSERVTMEVEDDVSNQEDRNP